MSKLPIIRGPKEYTEGGTRYRIVAHAALHHLSGNARPYFTLTGDIDRWNGLQWREDSGGMLHDAVLKHWPELADVAAMHLSDDLGEPMNAAANGWYWLAGAMGGYGEQFHGGNAQPPKTDEECLAVFAKYVRIGIDEAKALRAHVRSGVGETSAKALLGQWVESQRPRWRAEAEACIAKHGLTVVRS